MALDCKIILFLILIVVHLAKTDKCDFQRCEESTNSIDRVGWINDGITMRSKSRGQTMNNIREFPTIPILETPTQPYYPPDISFRFSEVGLQRIGRDFIKSDSIISLSLDNNNISDISPLAFRSMSKLGHLNLSGNRIPTEQLLVLTGNDNLQTLIINNNNDSNAEKTLKDCEFFKNLQYLHLCNNQLQDIQVPFLTATPSLTHLHLSNNSIRYSNVVFDNIPISLTHLHLNQNIIDRVEKDKFRYLLELVMDNNLITQVCFEECQDKSIPLRGVIGLQNLSLSRNQISEITTDAFNDMEHLMNLDLSYNAIDHLDKDIFNNTRRLIRLSLAHNNLAAIPNVCSMLRLESLNLTGNNLGAIFPNTFCRLPSLKYLYLSDNLITTIETGAFNLQGLTHLDLSGNQLKQLPEQLYFWRIQELHFERNYFVDLDHLSLKDYKTLKNVYLDENPMTKLKARSLHSLAGHIILHLKNIRVNAIESSSRGDQADSSDDYDVSSG